MKSFELDATVVISKMETTTMHVAIADKMQTKEINFYNLDAIISVGYRVNFQKQPVISINKSTLFSKKTQKIFAINKF